MRLFNRIHLKTPESVELEFILAGIGSRAFAAVIDYHVLWLTYLGFVTIANLVTDQLSTYLNQAGLDSPALYQWFIAGFILLTFAWFTGYFALFETLWRGQTPGKRWTKIRVIRDDGRAIGVSQAVLRALLRPLDDFLFLGFFFILLGKREKRLGDWAAGTVVIQEELPPIGSSFLPLSGQAQEVADHLIAQAQLTRLSPDDFAIIREYLGRRKLMDPKAKNAASLTLARQVKARLSLETLPFEMTADVFLEGSYLAYQQQFEPE
jgi:uncharacterized RDD family membrane protein YckC